MPLLFGSQYEGGPRYARERNMGLLRAFALFMREMPPRTILIVLTLMTGFRLYVGGWTWWDLVPVVAIPMMQPFAEWLIHVFILHHKPTKWFGRRVDYFSSRNHRMHHRDPWDCRFTVMPLQTATWVFLGNVIAWYLVMPTFGSYLTALLVLIVSGLIYEWTHFLIHTSYRPKGAFYRHLWRMHRLHHFKNENYWQCVVMPIGDRILGTNPDPDSIDSSPTARTLGVEDDLGASGAV